MAKTLARDFWALEWVSTTYPVDNTTGLHYRLEVRRDPSTGLTLSSRFELNLEANPIVTKGDHRNVRS